MRVPQRDGGRQPHMGKDEGRWQPGTSWKAGRDEVARSPDLVLGQSMYHYM